MAVIPSYQVKVSKKLFLKNPKTIRLFEFIYCFSGLNR